MTMRENHISNRSGGGGSTIVTKYFKTPLVFLVSLLFVVAILTTHLLDTSLTTNRVGSDTLNTIISSTTLVQPGSPALVKSPPTKKDKKETRKKVEFPLQCSPDTITCPTNYYPKNFHNNDQDRASSAECPEYFRWIHEDLKPWKETGITKEVVERARKTANFRLVVVDGKAYVETYQKAFQSRDTFTLWGILQLLRRYPGKVPDLDLMFDCVDWPVVLKKYYRGPNATSPPPLFRYCADGATMDIVFPDWSFWGWPEINIKPWEGLRKELNEGNTRVEWKDREPRAYWKGNPIVAETRMDLLKCNISDNQDWGALIYAQDWLKEKQQGFKQSDLASQCIHRYKIYIEGSAWSVSVKYILACNSVTFFVNPRYYDFFTRGLMPVQHYWPVKENDKCRSIKFAVEWGNRHTQKARAIGKAASDFVQNDLKMDYVYDYMFHLLNEYAKLLKYKPTIPTNAVELCSETMACQADGFAKKFMMESMVKGPADAGPCMMPPPYDPISLHTITRRKYSSVKTVESWEENYWQNRTRSK